MPVTYTYPESSELTEITPILIQSAIQDDPILNLFPIKNRNAAKLRWMIKDLYTGLMGLRGLGGEPTRINRVGEKVYEAEPGAYGNFKTIDEVEMTNRASGIPPGMLVPISVDDLVMEDKMHLTYLQVTRIKQILWALALNNVFSVPLPGGGIGHTDSYLGQTVTVAPLWSASSTASPLQNFRTLQPTFGFGTSGSFNGLATAWMNSMTVNYLLGNTNPNDLGGKRVINGATVNDLPSVNRILLDGDLPQIMIHNDGYIDTNGVFQLYVPTGKVLVVAKRPNGEIPGEFQMTRNANNPNMEPGPYSFVDDRTQGPTKTVPPRIDTHQGFNGGPAMERPSQLVTLTVA